MANILGDDQKQQILALGRLGWPLRRIEQAIGVRRETASAYLKAAGVAIRGPRRRRPPPKPASQVSTDPAKPASEVSTDFGVGSPPLGGLPPWPPPARRAPGASACEPYRELIELALGRGRNAMAIWQDLVDQHGFPARYASVRRFVGRLRGQRTLEAHPVIVTAPGEEGQVDYGDGPMVRHPVTGKYRRTRLFVFTLGYSRKSVRLLTFDSSARRWAQLHEEAFRRLGGAVRVVVLDNLKEGVLTPDVYDPALNPLYRDVLAHYGAVALPCRVGDPDRKGKVESAIGHTQKTPLKGLRFERLDEEAQPYLDRWEARWADTRIHGTTKRQVAAMFAEEQPHLLPLPLEPFRYYQYGTRTVHLDGCVEVAGAYYAPPPLSTAPSSSRPAARPPWSSASPTPASSGAISSATRGRRSPCARSTRSSVSSPTTATSSRGKPRRSLHERRRTAARAPPAPLLRPRRRARSPSARSAGRKAGPHRFPLAPRPGRVGPAAGSPPRAPREAGRLPRRRQAPRHLRLRLQQEDEPRPHLRARHRPLGHATRRRPVPRPARHGQEPPGPSARLRRDPTGPPCRLSRGPRPRRGSRRGAARSHPDGPRPERHPPVTHRASAQEGPDSRRGHISVSPRRPRGRQAGRLLDHDRLR